MAIKWSGKQKNLHKKGFFEIRSGPVTGRSAGRLQYLKLTASDTSVSWLPRLCTFQLPEDPDPCDSLNVPSGVHLSRLPFRFGLRKSLNSFSSISECAAPLRAYRRLPGIVNIVFRLLRSSFHHPVICPAGP